MRLRTENHLVCDEQEVCNLFFRLLDTDRNSDEFDRLYHEFDERVGYLVVHQMGDQLYQSTPTYGHRD